MNFMSLFSGIGGFDLGFERAGMTAAAMCEIDRSALSVLNRHWPDVPKFTDVREVKRDRTAGAIDLICGGFPCQDVSIAGQRAGLAGERSGLWFEFARILDEFEPAWAVIENVPGLLSSNKGKDFAVIIRWLAERGYGVVWRVLDAQYFGVPQRRRRVFIVASFGNGRAAEVLFEPESSAGNTPPSREQGQGIADTFTVRTGKAGGGKGYLGQESSAMTLGPQEQWLSYVMAHGQANAEIVRDGSPSLNTNHEAPIVWHNHQQDNSIRIQDGETSPTVAVGLRRLTPLECARLQGFPDDWTTGQSDSPQYKQYGNAVAVPVAEWIGKKIMQAHYQN